MHAVKCLQAEFVIYDHCTGTVKKKKRSMSTAVISRAILRAPAGPVLGLTANHGCFQAAVISGCRGDFQVELHGTGSCSLRCS